MSRTFSYLPYNGSNKYAFYGCVSEDEDTAATIADALIERNIRLYNEDFNGKYADSAETIANAIEKAESVIMFLSEKSIDNLLFRNAINYALSIRKPILCIKLDDSALAHGMEMQLANVKIVNYSDEDNAVNTIIESGIVTQEMIGEGMTKRIIDNKKKYIMAGMIAAAILIFVLSAVGVVNKRNSPEYILRNVDGAEYVDISSMGEDAIPYLSGKTVNEINMANGGFTNLNGIENVSAEIIDVSDNPNVVSLWPLTRVNGLKRVKISQDMRVFATDLVNAGIEVELKH